MVTFMFVLGYIMVGICFFEWANRKTPELNPPIIAGICVIWPAPLIALVVAIIVERIS